MNVVETALQPSVTWPFRAYNTYRVMRCIGLS
jgi:hypothetical protein